MTLIEDFEFLLGKTGGAKAIHENLMRRETTLREACDHILRLADSARLGIVRTTVLLMKCEDERRKSVQGGNGDADSLVDGDRPARELVKTLASYGGDCRVQNRHDLFLLVGEISMLGLDRLPLASPALAFIDEQRRITIEQLRDTDETMASRYRKLKHRWQYQNIELQGLEKALDDSLQRANRIREKFMQLFSREHCAERAMQGRVELAERRLELLRSNPGLNAADMERMLRQNRSKPDCGVSRGELGTPRGCLLSPPGGKAASRRDPARARSLWRELARLTHPDKLGQHKLAWAARCQLESIWHEVADLYADRQRFECSAGFLERKLQQARRILELAHIEDLDANLVVQGSTIGEQTRWLEEANEVLDNNLRNTRANLLRYTHSRELDRMQTLAEAPRVTQEEERLAMLERSEVLQQRAEMLERELGRLFGEHA